MLAAGLDGVEKGLELADPVEESLYAMEASIASRRRASRSSRERSARRSTSSRRTRSSRAALGEHVFRHYIEAKREEWDDYRTQVSAWEVDRYLDAF